MRKAMKAISWLVFLAFIALSSYANWLHGTVPVARFMLAVVPVGFAASVFILEGLISAGKASRSTFAAIGFVAFASGVASYLGLYGMARDSGIGLAQAVLMPLAFDGVVLVASMGIRGFSAVAHVPAPRPVSRPRVPRVKDNVPAVSLPVSEDVPAIEGHVPEADVPMSLPGATVRDTVPRAVGWDRELAVKLLSEGVPRKDIAQRCGTSRKTIDRLASQIASE